MRASFNVKVPVKVAKNWPDNKDHRKIEDGSIIEVWMVELLGSKEFCDSVDKRTEKRLAEEARAKKVA